MLQQISKISGIEISGAHGVTRPTRMNDRVGKADSPRCAANSPALHGRHDRNFVSGRELEISIDKFHTRRNQDALVMLPKFRLVRVELPKQVADGGSIRYVDIQLAHSDQVAQLRVEQYLDFHLIMSFPSSRGIPWHRF